MTYELEEKPIANDGSSVVYSTKDKQHALKRVDYKNYTDLSWVIEISVLTHLAHPKIVPLVGVIADETGCYIVMPRYVSLDHVKTQSICQRVQEQIALDVGEALAYMHEYGLIHTDIKKRNVLVHISTSPAQLVHISTSPVRLVKAILCDMDSVIATSFDKLFETHKIIPSKKINSLWSDRINIRPIVGSPVKCQAITAYPLCTRPPEIFEKKFISQASDVWSYGCLLNSIVVGGSGFNIQDCPPDMDWQDYVRMSTDGSALSGTIAECLQVNADNRPSMSTIVTKNVCTTSSGVSDCKLSSISDIVRMLPVDMATFAYLSKQINAWCDGLDVTTDCIKFCEHLVQKTLANPATKKRFADNAYMPVIICINIALQLFHRQVNIDLRKIYGVHKLGDLGYKYSNDVMWMLRVVFEYDILKK